MRKPAPAIQLRPLRDDLAPREPAQSPREGALWSQRTSLDAPRRRPRFERCSGGATGEPIDIDGRVREHARVWQECGPALYVNHLGSRRLARAMFLSALSVFAVTPRFSTYAWPRRAVRVYACVQLSGAVLLACLWVMLSYLERRTRRGRGPHDPGPLHVVLREDLTTLLVMMQNAAVAQELFTATAARRVVGLAEHNCRTMA